MDKDTLLIIFTRNPVLGQVKTRLAKKIGAEKALEVYHILLRKTASVTALIQTDKWVYYTPEVIEDDLWSGPNYSKKTQKGEDLGQRMENAFKDGFKAGYKRVVVIGSDLYELTPEDITMAFKKLTDHKVVLGPATDGGYYLIGLKEILPGLFENKNWGQKSVLKDTLSHFKDQEVALLHRYNDIDIYQDLEQHSVFQKYLNY